MKLLAALAVGYALGARSGGEDLDDVVRSLRAIKESDEFHDLIATVRTHAGNTLHELASMVERQKGQGSDDSDSAGTHDLVERVRHLAGLR